jgi:hypothetical protein
MRGAVALLAATILAGCSSEPTVTVPGEPAEVAGLGSLGPVPEAVPAGPAARAVRRIAREIQARYHLIEVWEARAEARGRLVVYAARFELEPRSAHPEFDDWNAHVRKAARDQREAAVAMLKATVDRLRSVRYVSVYQDELLQPFWSRRQIERMAEPRRYRTFPAWQKLVLSAARLPGRPGG